MNTKEFYQRHEAVISIATFVPGFLFDVLTLGRIDDLLNLVQQALYLFVLGALIIIEIRRETIWAYQDLVVHFLFGSLLSAYTHLLLHLGSASRVLYLSCYCRPDDGQ